MLEIKNRRNHLMPRIDLILSNVISTVEMSLIIEKEKEKIPHLHVFPRVKLRTHTNPLAFDKTQMAGRKRESIWTTFSLT